MSFILRRKGYEQWARFEKKGKAPKARQHLSWVGIDKATSFATVKELEDAFVLAYSEMRQAAAEKSAAMNAKGGAKVNSYFRWNMIDYPTKAATPTATMIARIKERWTHQDNFSCYYGPDHTPYDYTLKDIEEAVLPEGHLKLLFERYGYIRRETTINEYLPVWHVHLVNPKYPKEFLEKKCLLETPTQSQSLLEAQTAYYVRSPKGWLGERKAEPCFLPQMQQATLFYTLEAARSAVRSAIQYTTVRSEECALIKTQVVITQVEPFEPKFPQHLNDQETSTLHAGCEALQISSVIEQATTQRTAAIKAAQKEPTHEASNDTVATPLSPKNRL